MIAGKSVLAIIPARGGSKGIAKKNIRELAGKPLIGWTIDEAQKSKYIDRLILSSDDDQIIAVAQKYGCEVPFKRPAAISNDDTPGISPVLHAIEKLPGYEYVVLLQPTSPLRLLKDIDGCIEFCLKKGVKGCVSITEPQKSPYWMFSMDSMNRLKKLIEGESNTRRQNLPKVYVINGAVYVADTSYLVRKKTFISKKTIGYQMPAERSIDIDNELDLFLCHAMICRDPSGFNFDVK